MEPEHNHRFLTPCSKTVRGQPATLDVSSQYILFFNAFTLVFQPRDKSNPLLTYTHKSNVCTCRFSTDGRLAASIDERGTLIVHEILKQKLGVRHFYQGVMSGVKALAWTSDSKKIALVGSGKNKFGRVISIDTGTDVGEISGVSATLMTVDVRPCRPFRVVAGGDEYSLKYYEGPPFKFGHSKKTHTNFINQIRYSPSGDHYVSVGSDRRIVLYDKDGAPVKEHENAHDGGIYACGWTNSLDFVTGSADGTVRYWKVEGDTMVKLNEVPVWEEKKTLDHFIVGLACHEATVYVLCLNGEIKEIVEGKVRRNFDGWKGRLAAVLPLHGKSLLLADSCGKVFTTDVEDRSLRRETSIPGVQRIQDAAKSQNVIYFLTGDSKVLTYNIQTSSVHELAVDNAFRIVSTPDSFITFASNSMTKYTTKGQPVNTVKITEDITCVYEINNYILVGGIKGQVSVYSLNLQLLQTIIPPNPSKISALHFCNGKLFLGQSSGSIKVYNMNMGEEVALELATTAMGGHDAMVSGMVSQGNTLVSVGNDNALKIWDVETLMRKDTRADVHALGVHGIQLVGSVLVTWGGDLLVKFHTL